MSATLGANSYGKSAVRLVKISRDGQRDTIRDFTVDLTLEGAFDAAHTAGDNSMVLPTDTMKNVVYAKARETAVGSPEKFALVLVRHLLGASPSSHTARVRIAEHPWRRLDIGGRMQDGSFEHGGNESRVAEVTRTRDGGEVVIAGIDDLVIMKSKHSAFAGYPRDKYTTLRETSDRILATSLSVRW